MTLNKVCNQNIDCRNGSDEWYCSLPLIQNSYCSQIAFNYYSCDFQSLSPNSSNVSNDTLQKNSFKNLNILKIQNLMSYHSKFSISNFLELNILIIEKSEVMTNISNFHFPNLIYLSVIQSKLTQHSNIFKYQLRKLQYLDITNNPISSLSFLHNINSINLLTLDVSSTKIYYITRFVTSIITKLKILKASNCDFKKIETIAFSHLQHLVELHLNKTKLPLDSHYSIIKWTKQLKFIASDYFLLCCLVWKKVNDNLKCLPSSSIYMSCSNLLNSSLKRFVQWAFGILGCLTNAISLVQILMFGGFAKYYRLLLNFGDFSTSIYVLLIAVFDLFYDGIYLENAEYWTNSIICKFLGTLMTFSLCLSSFTMLCVTIERHQAVVRPLKSSFFLLYKQYIVGIIVVTCLLLSVLPFMANNVS